MSVFTKDKVWFSADKQTYWEHDPGGNSGAGDAALFLNGVEHITVSSDGVTLSDALTVGGALSVTGAVAASGRLSAVAGMSWSVEGSSAPIAGGSTLSLDAVVSVIAGTTGGLVYTMPAPSSAGIFKIITNISTASTGHIDFTTGVLIQGFATAGNLNLLPHGTVGLISLSTVAYKILFPTTVATVLFTTLST